jgi:hypothetical protein
MHLAEQLHRRAGLVVAIAAQTRAQALDVASRSAAAGAKVGLLGSREDRRPPGLDPRATFLAGVGQLSHWRGIVVATTARWLWVNERNFSADVCIVDFSTRPRGVLHVDSGLRESVWRTQARREYAEPGLPQQFRLARVDLSPVRRPDVAARGRSAAAIGCPSHSSKRRCSIPRKRTSQPGSMVRAWTAAVLTNSPALRLRRSNPGARFAVGRHTGRACCRRSQDQSSYSGPGRG